MFNRVQIKENAKLVLRRSYWMVFLVTLLAGLLINSSGVTERINYGFNTNDLQGLSDSFDYEALDEIDDFVDGIGPGSEMTEADAIEMYDQMMGAFGDFLSTNSGAIGKIFGVGIIASTLLSLLWMMFVSSPVDNGMSHFLIATREQSNPVEFSYALYGFKKNYLKQSWARCSSYIILLLFRLLASLPQIVGVIAAVLTKNAAFLSLSIFTLPLSLLALMMYYRYFFVSFIIANNSEISGKRARELSTEMTNGNKWNLFVFDLSFIGWYALGLLCCCIGVLFVKPYYMAAKAEAYTCLKAELIQQKAKSNDAELPSLVGAEY